MKTRNIGTEIHELIKENTSTESSNGMLVIKGEKPTSLGREAITLERSDEFISIWIGDQKRDKRTGSIFMDVKLYVYNRKNESLWVGSVKGMDHIAEGKVLFSRSVEYMCALNSMRSFIGDLFLIRPYDLRILEVMDSVGKGKNKSSVENYMRVLYKMIAND